jgi:hypothetical protein
MSLPVWTKCPQRDLEWLEGTLLIDDLRERGA